MIGGSLPVDARQADAERLGEGRDSKGLWRSSRAPLAKSIEARRPL
jgi:hypothetical protein